MHISKSFILVIPFLNDPERNAWFLLEDLRVWSLCAWQIYRTRWINMLLNLNTNAGSKFRAVGFQIFHQSDHYRSLGVWSLHSWCVAGLVCLLTHQWGHLWARNPAHTLDRCTHQKQTHFLYRECRSSSSSPHLYGSPADRERESERTVYFILLGSIKQWLWSLPTGSLSSIDKCNQ